MLRVVHISGQEESRPKKLTAKQQEAMEIQAMIEERYSKDRKAALKRIDQIRELIK